MASYGEWPAIPGHPGLSHAAAETEELLSHAIEETRSHPRPPRHEPAWMRNRSEALAMAGFASVKGQISAQPRPQKVGYNTHRILSARTRPPPDAENVDSLRKEYTAGAASGGSRGKVALKPSSAPMAHNRSGSARLLGNRSAGMRPQTAKSEPGVGVGLGPGVGVGLGPESGLPEPRKKFGRATSLTLKKWEKPAISQA
ncbi:hypothetical protein T484DRAFT_1764998 [Baffinella frigidus]|nr:hypothetical protein T484DRAFT_1764998 [Cryptophyta sp. CCMP2293]